MVKFSQGKIDETFNNLLLSISKSENLRGFLKDNDQFKISLSDVQNSPFRFLSACFCYFGNPNNALYVEELARARALADLMATQYSVESEISANPQSWIGIENIMKKESNCVCLYISYYYQDVFLWILKTSGVIRFRRITVDENFVGAGLVGRRELSSFATCRGRRWRKSKYRIKCFFVFHLLEEPEIIIVPDRSLNQVPFAALSDEGGKYLSDTFRIRIVSSLSTLKLIQHSPADYHSQTGALIVGDPVVGRVRYMGRVENFKPLPCARKEAEMIGELLGVQPLLGQCANKQAVLERLHSIRAEGVVGIARAFLGSGARSVLVALWAIEDRATEQLMRRFYEHLVRGKSAGESLHEAMKWMRGNGFTKVSEWAPFMLMEIT
ncbi:hypothetical protein ACROYT_G000535 [Oculina patagonica]